jgi:hypothetical protein
LGRFASSEWRQQCSLRCVNSAVFPADQRTNEFDPTKRLSTIRCGVQVFAYFGLISGAWKVRSERGHTTESGRPLPSLLYYLMRILPLLTHLTALLCHFFLCSATCDAPPACDHDAVCHASTLPKGPTFKWHVQPDCQTARLACNGGTTSVEAPVANCEGGPFRVRAALVLEIDLP